jgi:transcriptional regulator GlxA family with amidase domain
MRRPLVPLLFVKPVSSNPALAAIALDAGFADQAHMTRLLRDRLRLSPTEFRALSLTGE